MKTLSVQQPWASLLAEGVKPIELRTWSTNYRGLLLVRASRNSPIRWENDADERIKLPTECLLFVGDLVSVKPMLPEDRVGAMSFYWNDEFSWHIRFCYYVRPTPAAGKLKLYETADALAQRLQEPDIRTYHPELKHRSKHPFRASVVGGEIIVVDSRTGEQTYYTVHLDHAPPLAWVFVPMFAYVGGLRGGNTKISWKEVAVIINQGNCFLRVEDLPIRTAKPKKGA